MLDDINKAAKERMTKALEALRNELNKIRTGRAHPSFIEHIKVNCYGNDMPLNQIANISVKDSRTLAITPWDKNSIQAIEKAIMQADLGLNPSTAGAVIHVPLPQLTEERRRDLVKIVKVEGENGKVAVRNIRRDANDAIKKLFKDKHISEDEERKAQENVQKLTDSFIVEIDKALAAKEQDLMAV